MARLALLLFAALVSAATPAFQLPSDVVPLSYSLDLRIDPAEAAYEGTARIDVEIRKAVTAVWLNAKDLTVTRAEIDASGQARNVRWKTAEGEFLALDADAPLPPGRARLTISFRAQLSDRATTGPFRRNIDGVWMAFTTFTPIEARRAFPCFDEPRFKTPWTLTLRVRRGHQAFANAPSLRVSEERDGWQTVRFAETRPLPSELVAFAVGPFVRLDGGRIGEARTPVGVIAPPGLRSHGQDAIDATRQVLPLLETYTAIPYPFEKLDHIALPQSSFGATENPGLITYEQRRLLAEPGARTPDQLRALRRLVAHELAHQWFGNLVTQSDWTDVWLSEGFATWLSEKLIDEEEPPARRGLRTVTARERIMRADTGPRAFPVRREMDSRDAMASVYNRFVYQKAAAVLFMLEAWLGEARFRESARAYLVRHRDRTAGTDDLAAAIRSVTEVDTSRVLASFLDQTGAPEVRVATVCEAGAAPRLRVELPAGPKKWSVPVCWRAPTTERVCAVIESPRREVELPQGARCPAWIFPNAGGTGYYRVDWRAGQLEALPLRELTAAERLSLVHDLHAMRQRRALPPQGGELLARLKADPEPEVSRAARDVNGKGVEQ